jgi:CheY-like chemotaxis protein
LWSPKDTLEILTKRVTSFGYEVIKAGNSKEAIAYAETEAPDLIFMDIDLPDPDAIKTTGRLRQNSKTSLLAIIAITHGCRNCGDKRRRTSVSKGT